MNATLRAAFGTLAIRTGEVAAGTQRIEAIASIRPIRSIATLLIVDVLLCRSLGIAFARQFSAFARWCLGIEIGHKFVAYGQLAELLFDADLIENLAAGHNGLDRWDNGFGGTAGWIIVGDEELWLVRYCPGFLGDKQGIVFQWFAIFGLRHLVTLTGLRLFGFACQ